MDLPAHFLVWLASEEAKFLKSKFVWANWDAQDLIKRAKEIRTTMLLRVCGIRPIRSGTPHDE